MVSSTSMLAALVAIIPLIAAGPIPAATSENPANIIKRAPQFFSGPASNFPPLSSWIGFDDMFNRNKNSMFATGDVGEDVGRIYNAIKDAATIGVDERVILGIIMQESHGDVGVRTTIAPDGVPTAGLMQAQNCPGHPGQHSLSQADITAMVRCGTQHFKANLQNWGNQLSAASIYPALREYNSGSVNVNDLSDARGATASYVSDISQRLTGWTD